MAPRTVFLKSTGQRFVTVDREQLRRGAGAKCFRLPGKFRRFGAVTPPPASFDWSRGRKIDFPVLGNNRVGDCFYVAACHAVQLWTGNVNAPAFFVEAEVVKRYRQLSGGDRGLDDATMYAEWLQGIVGPRGPYKIFGSLLVDPRNPEAIRAAMFYFGGAVYTAALLDTWLTNAAPGATWDAGGTPDRYAGHAMLLSGVNGDGTYADETWGFEQPIRLTQRGLEASDPEVIVQPSLDWFNENGMAPNGLHYSVLASIWTDCGGDPWPDSPFPPEPSPVPVPDPTPVPPITPPDGLAFMVDCVAKLPASLGGFSVPLNGWVRQATVTPARGEFADTFGLPPWVLLLIALSSKLAPIILADLAAGKSWQEILADIIAALGNNHPAVVAFRSKYPALAVTA